jgi:hypothetical protein
MRVFGGALKELVAHRCAALSHEHVTAHGIFSLSSRSLFAHTELSPERFKGILDGKKPLPEGKPLAEDNQLPACFGFSPALPARSCARAVRGKRDVSRPS